LHEVVHYILEIGEDFDFRECLGFDFAHGSRYGFSLLQRKLRACGVRTGLHPQRLSCEPPEHGAGRGLKGVA
jgi:hypothetical protein